MARADGQHFVSPVLQGVVKPCLHPPPDREIPRSPMQGVVLTGPIVLQARIRNTIRTCFATLALGLAIGTGPAFLPTLAQAQVPTSQFSPGSTPLNDSRSNRCLLYTSPSPRDRG